MSTPLPVQSSDAVPPERKPFWQVALLALMAGMGSYSASAYITSYFHISEELHVPLSSVHLSLTTYLFFYAFCSLFAGAFADAVGRKRAVLMSTSVFMLGTLLSAVAPSWHVLLLARAIQGIGVSVGGIVAQASIRDSYSGAQADRMTSLMTAMFAISPGLSPIIGMWITAVFDWRAVFLSLFVYACIVMVLVSKFYVDPLPVSERRPFDLRVLFAAWKKGLSRLRFVGGILAHAGSFTGAVLYLAGTTNLAFYVLKIPPNDFMYETLPLMAMSTTGALLAHFFVGRFGNRTMTAVGLGLMLVAGSIGLISLLEGGSLMGLLICPMIYQVGMSIASPLMMNSNMSDFPDHHAIGASLQQSFCTAGFAFGSAMWAPVSMMDDGFYVAIMVASAILACVVWCYGTLLVMHKSSTA